MANCIFARSIYLSLNKINIFKYSIFRHMSYAKFLPINFNLSASQREKEVKELYALFRPDNSTTNKKILMKYLGVSELDAYYILEKYEKNFSSMDLVNRINILNDVFPSTKFRKGIYRRLLFENSPAYLHHRIMMMKELEIPITYHTTSRFSKITNGKICDLQKNGFIGDYTMLIEEIFQSFQAPEEVIKMLPSKSSHARNLLKDFWAKVNKIFLMWQLELSEEMYQKKGIMAFCQRTLSLTYQYEIIQLLRKNLNMDNNKILDQFSLLYGHPAHYAKYFESERKSCGIPIKDLVRKKPSLMKKPIESFFLLDEIMEYINCKNVGLQVPLLNLKIVLSRIAYFIRKTSLSDFRLTPNKEYYIRNFHFSIKTIKEYELENGPIKHLPFIERIKDKSTNQGFEPQKLMNQVLYSYFGLSLSEYRLVMEQIGLVNFPQLHEIKSNFAFLLNKGFSDDNLKHSFQILFFPHDLVVKTYYELPDTTKYMKLYQENNDRDKIIHLLLYKVYKNYHSLSASLSLTS